MASSRARDRRLGQLDCMVMGQGPPLVFLPGLAPENGRPVGLMRLADIQGMATFAKHIGRAVAFSQAAFRQAFAGGRDLGDEGTVLIAAAACEMHPTALLKGMRLRSVVGGLRDAGERARAMSTSAV